MSFAARIQSRRVSQARSARCGYRRASSTGQPFRPIPDLAPTKLSDVSTSTSILAATQLSADLREQADLIRGRAAHLHAAGTNIRWRSLASAAFHGRLQTSIATLLRSAAYFDNGADEIAMLAVAS